MFRAATGTRTRALARRPLPRAAPRNYGVCVYYCRTYYKAMVGEQFSRNQRGPAGASAILARLPCPTVPAGGRCALLRVSRDLSRDPHGVGHYRPAHAQGARIRRRAACGHHRPCRVVPPVELHFQVCADFAVIPLNLLNERQRRVASLT